MIWHVRRMLKNHTIAFLADLFETIGGRRPNTLTLAGFSIFDPADSLHPLSNQESIRARARGFLETKGLAAMR